MAKKKAKTKFEGKSIDELRKDLKKLTLDITAGKEKNTNLRREIKKQIARLLTKVKSEK